MITATPTIPSPTDLLTLCAFCWLAPVTRKLRSAGGWDVGTCDGCHERHETEPALRPAEVTR